jgi:hypothetical protein
MSLKLTRLAERFPTKAAQAVTEVLLEEVKESKRRTPVSLDGTRGNPPGFLRDSHEVEPISFRGRLIVGTIVVTADYALPVHERTGVFHRVGQAKFLESTMREARVHIGPRIARKIDVTTMHF